MEISLKDAVRHFIPTGSLEMVYFEAIANSLDSGSTKIRIEISLKEFEDPSDLEIKIFDNGSGLNEENFQRFKIILNPKSESHKGVGRLTYLKYFDRVDIKSIFDGKIRHINFDINYKGEFQIEEANSLDKFSTEFHLYKFKGDRIHDKKFVNPGVLKIKIMRHFQKHFFMLKRDDNRELEIEIVLNNELRETITKNDIKGYKYKEYRNEIQTYYSLGIYYLIEEKQELMPQQILTDFIVDGRAIESKISELILLPDKYDSFFFFESEFFDSKVDSERQKLTLEQNELRQIEAIIKQRVKEIIEEQLPDIQSRNLMTIGGLEEKNPHLIGYIHSDNIGLIDTTRAIDKARTKFFKEQKAILECDTLDDDQFEKAMQISSRQLAEYILYRNKIIDKLKDSTYNDGEGFIHDLFVKRKKIINGQSEDSRFINNVWLLDDKFLTYNYTLSDQELEKIYSIVEENHGVPDLSRPDIAIIFSADINQESKVDMVIVELKRRHEIDTRSFDVNTQLTQRARSIINQLGDKIQRIWFYGIIDIDTDMSDILLSNKYIKLYSTKDLYYASKDITITNSFTNEQKIYPANFFIQSFDGLIGDAEIRNTAFLDILKEGFRLSK